MKIAYLGWGSLIWEPRELSLSSEWMNGGPVLPIEFSRISDKGRITLVIDEVNGVPIETYYAHCSIDILDVAVNHLAKREGSPQKRIGYVDLTTNTNSLKIFSDQAPFHKYIAKWASVHNFDSVIWTALPSNFSERRNVPYSVDNALSYLENLPDSDRRVAFEYIINAPTNVQTPFRRRFSEVWKSRLL